MPPTPLPHTAGCIVCGRDNPHGLHLSLGVDPATGIVTTEFEARPEHIGFEGIVHGGVLATVLDEAMVWAATWAGRRFCVCGELNVRYRNSAPVGAALRIEARVDAFRSRLIETTGSITDAAGIVYATATGKYVPVAPDRNAQFVATLVASPQVRQTLEALQSGS
ncbi:MAG TPA: PaaI family thioesterase [Tepidisphaeraceae bacterium]|nr:PaaI family thioesterase [Tepidisphaeraceae bacterium]